MREMILQALKSKISGQINGHIANIEAMMTNPVGIGDHPTIVETIEKELSLSGVQRPITEDQLAGEFINWFRFGDFSGYLIEKPA